MALMAGAEYLGLDSGDLTVLDWESLQFIVDKGLPLVLLLLLLLPNCDDVLSRIGLWDCVRSRVVSDALNSATACRFASADTVIPALPLPILKPPYSDKMLSYLNSGGGS